MPFSLLNSSLLYSSFFTSLFILLSSPLSASELPVGSTPPAVEVPWFPSPLHAVVWRNWNLIPTDRIATTLHASPEQIEQLATSMGLPPNRPVPDKYDAHTYKTVLRRNWHLLPYDQLLTLLDKSADELAFLLHEDDFLFIKLGSLKPKCEPVIFSEPDEPTRSRAAEIKRLVEQHFGDSIHDPGEPRFAFIDEFATPPKNTADSSLSNAEGLRYLYAYYAVFGDPLLDTAIDPYPDGLLARLADSGVNGVWLHVVLRQLAPGGETFPEWGADHEKRLANLKKLVDRADRHGIKVYLYMNEPRAMPAEFFTAHPDLAGVTLGELTTICTSDSRARNWMRDSLTHVFRAVPDLGGVFTITASENLTSCASHGLQGNCPRCRDRSAAEIIAEVNGTIAEGVHAAAPDAKVIAWDWGWNCHGDAADHIALLPEDVWLQSVSEWSLPIERGGIKNTVGEYSISAVGPGPRAIRHWSLAKARGLKAVAKVQINNTWELSAVPFLPVLDLVAEHADELAEADIDGLMLSWSLGGSPSPNIEVVTRLTQDKKATPDDVLSTVARNRYGDAAAPHIRAAWTAFSAAFREFPYHGAVVYRAPQQFGPSNPLFMKPTGYASTMIGFPYDDLTGWRGNYPPEVFAAQFRKVAEGWQTGLAHFDEAVQLADPSHKQIAEEDRNLARAAHAHFASTANQIDFVITRDALIANPNDSAARNKLTSLAEDEIQLARTLYDLTKSDSRIGFEASNAYYYTPLDLIEKNLNCEHIKSQLGN